MGVLCLITAILLTKLSLTAALSCHVCDETTVIVSDVVLGDPDQYSYSLEDAVCSSKTCGEDEDRCLSGYLSFDMKKSDNSEMKVMTHWFKRCGKESDTCETVSAVKAEELAAGGEVTEVNNRDCGSDGIAMCETDNCNDLTVETINPDLKPALECNKCKKYEEGGEDATDPQPDCTKKETCLRGIEKCFTMDLSTTEGGVKTVVHEEGCKGILNMSCEWLEDLISGGDTTLNECKMSGGVRPSGAVQLLALLVVTVAMVM